MTYLKLKNALFAGLATLALAGGATVVTIDSAEAQWKGRGGGWHGGGHRGGWGGHRGVFRGTPGVYRGTYYRGGGYGGRHWGGGYRHAYWGGHRGYRRGISGGAVAAGLFGGLALGAIAASSYPYYDGYYPAYSYGYAPVSYGYGYGTCYWVSPGVQVCE